MLFSDDNKKKKEETEYNFDGDWEIFQLRNKFEICIDFFLFFDFFCNIGDLMSIFFKT